jgi:hypothetical protein
MAIRLMAGLLMLTVGTLSLYVLVTKPQHDWSKSEVDQAFGIPPIVNRVIRGIFSVIFIVVGFVSVLRAINILH